MPITKSDPIAWDARAIKDLQWCIESPSLISSRPQSLEGGGVSNWEYYRKPLASFLKTPPQHRVGKYFEALNQFWLEHICQVKLITQNHQVIEEGQTKGELDFVFQSKHNEIVHWETAVKFYLYHDSETSLGSHYIGPNTSDTFERKMERLFNKQLPLGAEAFPQTTRHEAQVRGRIFYHPHHSRPDQIPNHLSEEHRKGTWLKVGEWEKYMKSAPHEYFRILRKPYWLSEESYDLGTAQDVHDRRSFQKCLQEHFYISRHSLLVGAFKVEEQRLREIERFFIVENNWPKSP